MIDFSEMLQNHLLQTDLPVYFEHFLTKDTEVPCVSWRLDDDYTRVKGDNLGFNWIYVSVKIWGKNKETFATYAPIVDYLMSKIGFKERIGTNELWTTGIGQYEMRYRGSYMETYDTPTPLNNNNKED